jgi:hypothetical protein
VQLLAAPYPPSDGASASPDSMRAAWVVGMLFRH